MKLELARIVGTASQNGWSQVYTYLPEETAKAQSRGQLLAVFALSSLKEISEIAGAGRELIGRLHEEYYGSLGLSAFQQLKITASRVYLEISQEASLEIISASIVDRTINLAISGGGQIWLKRKDQLVNLLKTDQNSNQTNSASGYLEEGDLLLLGTSRFFELVPQGVITPALANNTVEEISNSLSLAVVGKENEDLAAGLVIKVNQDNQVPAEGRQESRPARKFKLKINFDFLKHQSKRPAKQLFTILGILTVLLITSLIFGHRQQQKSQSDQQIQQILQTAKDQINQNQFKSAQESLRSIQGKSIKDPQLVALKKQLEEILTANIKDYLVQPAIFYDLSLIKKEAQATDWLILEDRFLVTDQNHQSLYQITINNKNSTILAGGDDLNQVSQITSIDQQIYFLAEKGIYQITANQQPKLVVEKKSDWGEIRDLQVFNNNLYLLTNLDLYQLPATDSGFSSPRSWLKAKVDLSQTSSMMIDGSIYLLKKPAEIIRFIRGNQESFRLTGLDQPMEPVSDFYTTADSEKLYLLAGNNLLVFDKSGRFFSHYYWENLEPTKSLIIDESNKKCYLLSNNKIYLFELK